jgi:replication-associated recombination protein RarA
MSEYYDPWAYTTSKHGISADLLISAMQKCIRRGQEDLAMRFAYELYITSQFHEEKLWNRLLVICVEDIGFGDPNALVIVKTLNDLRKEFPYLDGDRPIFFLYAIRYLCRQKKERSTDQIKNIIMMENAKGEIPEIPDYAIDMHTNKGRFELGRDVFYFLDEASKVIPLADDYDDKYFKQLYKMYEEQLKDEKKDK